MRRIVRSLSGRWSELAAQEVSQLELALRLDVIHALEETGRDRALPAQRAEPHEVEPRARPPHPGRAQGAELGADAADRARDKDPDVRNVAARSRAYEAPGREEALVELLGKHDQAVSARIAAICIEMARARALLIRALREGTPKARFWPPASGRDPGSARKPARLGTP